MAGILALAHSSHGVVPREPAMTTKTEALLPEIADSAFKEGDHIA